MIVRWFELVDLIHKLILTSLVQLVRKSAQLPFALFITFAYLALLILKVRPSAVVPFNVSAQQDPYIHRANSRLHVLAETDLWLFVLAAHVSYDQLLDNAADSIMSACLVLACVFFVAFFSVQL